MKLLFNSWATGEKYIYFLFGGLIFVIVFTFLYLRITRQKITTKIDLVFIEGQLAEHFINYTRSHGVVNYSIELNNYHNSFIIDGRNRYVINKSGFDSLLTGEIMTIGISRNDTSLLKTNGPIYIFFLSGADRPILSFQDAISNRNNNDIYYICSGLFLISILLFYLGIIVKTKSQE